MIQNQFAVPGTIDVPLILTSLGHDERYINDHQDKYNYILHKIVEGRVFNKSMSPRGFTNLNKKILRGIIGKRYTDTILQELITNGIVETDRHYINNHKSTGYRISNEYNTKCVLRNIFKTEVWVKKMQKMHNDYVAKLDKDLATEWNNLNQICINDEKAFAFIDEKYAATMGLLESFKDSLDIPYSFLTKIYYSGLIAESKFCRSVYSLMVVHLLEDELKRKENANITAYQLLKESITSQYNADIISIKKIVNEDYFIEQPDKESRIYTNLTNISTDLRQFLYHKTGKNFVNQDIKNSQPYIFNILLRDKYKGQVLPKDVQDYITLTSTGKFYEYVMNLLDVPEENRKAFKIQFFAKIFYCTTHYSVRTKEGKLFENEFPNVYKLINQYKEESYKNLSIKMQKTEANIILHGIGGELKQRGIWYSTIHDSVVVMKEHQEEVKALIISKFLSLVGVEPGVKTEDLLGGLV